ncbi:hypothetical protein [Reichenbachiella sp.]|uniref:hypothetical protein n=1 Tax=Reichenbachiella sp. TaxID=2184521 RepID=UPI003BB0F3B6
MTFKAPKHSDQNSKQQAAAMSETIAQQHRVALQDHRNEAGNHPIQRKQSDTPLPHEFNLIGETHSDYYNVDNRRSEIAVTRHLGFRRYFMEESLQVNLTPGADPEYDGQFGGARNPTAKHDSADPSSERIMWLWKVDFDKDYKKYYTAATFGEFQNRTFSIKQELDNLISSGNIPNGIWDESAFRTNLPIVLGYVNEFNGLANFHTAITDPDKKLSTIESFLESCLEFWNLFLLGGGRAKSSIRRSKSMSENAQKFGTTLRTGIWKVGDDHLREVYEHVENQPGGDGKTDDYIMVREHDFKVYMKARLENSFVAVSAHTNIAIAMCTIYRQFTKRSLCANWLASHNDLFSDWVLRNYTALIQALPDDSALIDRIVQNKL